MASKSKKRRRVLGASCILAALIIAGSSFAWFTSKDEVTNRLTANADYGVSIVESFEPTTKWLPGQQVNKDVYAVNTGSIAALVKEEIDTRMAITYEADEKDFSADCVELKGDERYAIEAGSFLAYRPSDSKYPVSGYQIVTRPEDNEGNVPKKTDFEPDKKGLYVFRRDIDVNAADQTETFKYDAYYFVPAGTTIKNDKGEDVVVGEGGRYYKVSNLQVYQDSHVAEYNKNTTTWTFNDYMGDDVFDDGALMVASGTFRKEKTDYVDPMDLTYLKLDESAVTTKPVEGSPAPTDEYYGMDKGQYLVATYDRGNNKVAADATAKAEAYDKAIHEYEYALALYNAAKSEYDTAHDTVLDAADKALNGDPANPTTTPGATKNLEDAQTIYQNRLTDYNNKLTAYNNKLDKLKEAKTAYENSMKKLYGHEKGGTGEEVATGTEGKYTADSLYGKYATAKAAREAANIGDDYKYNDTASSTGESKGIEDEFKAYKDAVNAGKPNTDPDFVSASVYTDLDTAGLKKFRDWVDENTANEEHDHWMLVIDEIIAETNYNNEKAKCLGSDAGNTNYYNAANNTLGKAYKDALDEYKTAYSDLGDISKQTEYNSYVDGSVIAAADNATANSGAKAALDTAYDNLNGKGEAGDAGYVEGAVRAYNTALKNYNDALKASNAAEELKDTAEALKEAADQVQAAAKGAYEAVDDSVNLSKTDGKVKIYIKLNDAAVITTQDGNTTNEMWLLDPVTLGTASNGIQTGTLLNNKAVFYYTGLLEGGETSSKLVDYVYLDDAIQANDYKNFDFDINVALKSAQVTFDEKGNIKTDAAQTELNKFATYFDGNLTTDVNKVVKWSDNVTVPADPAAASFKVGTTNISTPSAYVGIGDLADYHYQVTLTSEQATAIGGTAEAATYVGTSQVGTYYKVNGTSVDSTKTINVVAG